MINALQLAANVNKTFKVSINEKKEADKISSSELKERTSTETPLVSTLKLNNQNLVYTLRSPFDAFVKTIKNGEWCALEDSNL